MIELGNYNELKILRDTSVGLFLGSEGGTEILLPNKYVPKSYEIGDKLNVFCYLDHDERPVATSLDPFVRRNQFGFLRVAEVNNFGAFLDWGLEKHLLVPFREQREKMKEGQWYVVYCYLDEQSFRLVGSNKPDKFLDNENLTIVNGAKVDLIVTRLTDLGWEVIINHRHRGLVYSNEVYGKLAIGDSLKGYIKNVRPDKKIDVSLRPLGKENLEPTAEKILQRLKQKKGYLPLHDKSSPDDIIDALQMSKKSFKKGIGVLYKARKIVIKDDGIYLV